MKRVSVAMAVYNGAAFLREQLDSVLCQLEPQDELILSYDKSTDGTWEILCEYASRFPQVKITENDTPGVIGNFNHAIASCTGDYIFMSDQDDRWAENKRAAILETFEKTGADAVIHNGVSINREGEVISKPFFETERIGNGRIRNILKSRYSGCCMAFTREMAKKCMPIPSKTDAWDRWMGTVSEFLGTIAYDERILLYHRLHGDNVTPDRARGFSVILKSRWQLVRDLRRRCRRERGR